MRPSATCRKPLLRSRPDKDEERRGDAASLNLTYRDYLGNPHKQRNWAADNPGNMAIRAELMVNVVEFAGKRLGSDGKILDIGCGGGWTLNELAQCGVEPKRLHGVDLIEARVDVARRRLPATDIRLADASKLPFSNGEFELVLLLTCLSSMPNHDSVRRALAEANRVLTQTGLLLCYEPRIANPFNRATRRISRQTLRRALGQEEASRRLTGLPPVARRFGVLTPRLYPPLTRLAPTHRLSRYRPRHHEF
jgi:ubiquinone/menaquinone biosynthesis C-methylase UbiE